MNEVHLAVFQKAYQDLDLFPLVEPENIEKFRVDYGREAACLTEVGETQ